jgi:DNA-binding response OmpR family regulator
MHVSAHAAASATASAGVSAATASGQDMTTKGKKILLIDDDASLRAVLVEQLELYDGFTTIQAATGAEGLEIAKKQLFDAILLDVALPDGDGRDICKLMRREGVRAPILMLTGADTDADTILGLDSGANDYVTKPFRINVLLARLRAHLRQHERSEDAVLQIGPYEFQPAAKMLLEKGGKKKVRLTEKETSILKYLYRAGARAVGRDQLLGEVWGYNAGVTTHTLETHIYRLRQKIEKDPANAAILVTDKGGYRLQP